MLYKSIKSNSEKEERDQESTKRQLIDLSIRSLESMYDAESQLFCYRLKLTDQGLLKEGLSIRYTIITLLGLSRLDQMGIKSPFDVQALFRGLYDHLKTIKNIGDVGLMIWLCALVSPRSLKNIFSDLDVLNALGRYRDAIQGYSMELAWFLSGLTHAFLARGETSSALSKLAEDTYRLLFLNYAGNGIFGHQHRSSVAGALRGRIGSFADQVYPIYALSKYGQVNGDEKAISIALDCAKKICDHQGPLGQWWWHYDSLTGGVIGRYPVYSVHQDGMAPMALFAVTEATGFGFNESIYKGLKWITGNNEVGQDLIDRGYNVIWRCLYTNKYKMYLEEATSLLGFHNKNKDHNDLKLKCECRPYHAGWLLYAFN